MKKASLLANNENVTLAGRPNNILKLILFIVGEIVMLSFLFLIVQVDAHVNIIWFYNVGSILSVYGTTLLMLLNTGVLPDFFRSFIYCLKQPEDITEIQVKRSLLSIKLAMVTAVVAELFELSFCFVSMMNNFSSMDISKESWAVFLNLTAFGGCTLYGILAVLILLPVYVRLKIRFILMQTP